MNRRKHFANGFSLVEMLVVIGIIAIMAAVSIPSIIAFMRSYRVNGAAQQVAGAIQEARIRAISRSVNLGVTFIPGYPQVNQFQFILEDSVQMGAGSNLTLRQPAPPRAAPVSGPPNGEILTLPPGVTFVAATGATAKRGIRFSRLGAACAVDPSVTSAACPVLAAPEPGGALYVNSATGNMVISVTSSGIIRTITVGPGGRGVVR